MALLNALKTGTYSTVRVTRYCKHGKELEVKFIVDIYEDNTKDVLLASINKSVDDISVDKTVADRGIDDAPASPSYGDTYTVGLNPTGEYSEFAPGKIVEWVEDGETDINGVTSDAWIKIGEEPENAVIYVTSEGKYYRVTDGVWKELVGYVGPVEWDLYFNTSSYNEANKSLMKGIYDYLKTTPEFMNTVDA